MICYRRQRRRRHPKSLVEALPDDLLLEILLRLPPQPSSLPRVSVVCKRWQHLITNTKFIARFHAHHRTPPLLGYFAFRGRFYPTEEPRCRTPPTLTSLHPLNRERGVYWWGLLDCRHGLVLTGATRLLEFKFVITEFTVFDPMIGNRYIVTTEPQPGILISAAVVAGAGGTNRSSFSLVALFSTNGEDRVTASVYSSDSGVWVNSVTVLVPSSHVAFNWHPSTLVGKSIYWLLDGGNKIIRFNLETQCLAFMEEPPHVDVEVRSSRWIISAGDDHLGLASLSERRIQFWERDIELSSAAAWKLCKTVQLDNVLPLELKDHMSSLRLIGFAEEHNVIFICAHDAVFMSHIKSLQFKKVHTTSGTSSYIHPYSSF